MIAKGIGISVLTVVTMAASAAWWGSFWLAVSYVLVAGAAQ